MIADLHLHSYYSDGTQPPEEIAEEAKSKGIGLISLCDHNVLSGLSEFEYACKKRNIKYISGVEIDCLFGDKNLHILAYNFDLKNKALIDLLSSNYAIMEQMSIDLIKKMSNDYSSISLKEYETFNRIPRNGGWKGIDYLRSKGFSISYPDCMKYYREYNIKNSNEFQDLKTVCKIIHEAGGVAVLAHPGDRLDQNPDTFITSLRKIIELGVDGVECFYPSHSKSITKLCVDFCREEDLIITAGSDSHGEFASYINGVYYAMGVVMVDTENLNLKELNDAIN